MDNMPANRRRLAMAGGIAAVLAGAAYFSTRVPPEVAVAPPAAESEAAPAVEVEAASEKTPKPDPEPAVEAAGEPEASETPAQDASNADRSQEAGGSHAEVTAAEPAVLELSPDLVNTAPDALTLPGGPAAPGVDVVRVTPEGHALVAGTAAPGALVGIYADHDRIAEVQADQSGNFVAMFQAEPGPEAKTLTLEAAAPDGPAVVSEDVVVLLPAAEAAVETPGSAQQTKAGEAAKAVVAEVEEENAVALDGMAEQAVATTVANADAEAAVDPASEPPDEPAGGVADAGDAAPAAEAEEEPAVQVAATAVVRDGVAQVVPLARPAGVLERDISLASISYVDGGLVTLAGFGLAGAELRAYVDDGFSRGGEVGGGGRWAIELGDVSVGVHQLRIDQMRPDGSVGSRVETPFLRALPQPEEPVVEGAQAPVSVVVQPGSNLWTLARIHYGSGVLYTQIFNANSELIRDPHLIYPGQIFDLPEAGE